MGSTFDSVDVIYIRKNMFFKIIVVGHGNFYRYHADLIKTFYKKSVWNKRSAMTIFIQHFYKLDNSALAVEALRVRLSFFVLLPQVGNVNGNFSIKESQFSQPSFKNISFVNRLLE